MSQTDPNGYDDMPDDMGPEAFDMGPEEAEGYEQRMWAGGARPPIPRPPFGPRPPGGWQPGFRPPPWAGPVGPGRWPFWGYWGYRMLSAWKDIGFLKKLTGEIVTEDILQMIKDGIILPGPNSPVQGPGGPTTGITGPITGVTDGSPAGPGEVGEVLLGSQDGSIPTSEATNSYVPLVLSAGDWDVQAWTSPQYSLGLSLQLAPPIVGADGDMLTTTDILDPVPGGGSLSQFTATSHVTRINISAPIPLVFSVHTNYWGSTAQVRPITLYARARRMR